MSRPAWGSTKVGVRALLASALNSRAGYTAATRAMQEWNPPAEMSREELSANAAPTGA